jgi:hypothetical protein
MFSRKVVTFSRLLATAFRRHQSKRFFVLDHGPVVAL